MDSDFWVCRLAAAKRQFLNHHNNNFISQLDRLKVDELDAAEEEEEEDDDDEEEEDEEEEEDGEEEEEDEGEELDYPCPYCGEEYGLLALCSHLQFQHPSETTLAMCTICGANVSKNMLRHITIQHERLIKMPRPSIGSSEVAIPRSQALSHLGSDLREARRQMLSAGKMQRSSASTVDPLMSSLVLNIPAPGAEEISKLVTSCAEEKPGTSAPAEHIWEASLDPSLSTEERIERRKQAAGKAAFVQDLVCSTMFSD